MRTQLTISVLLVILGLGLPACRSGKTVASDKEVRIGKSEATDLYQHLTNGESFTWYTGKARLKASTPDARMSATINLRILRDSVIWATIDKLGIEVGRVLITPDSVMVVDRLNKEYMQRTFRSFLAEYGVQINFSDLQNALTGRMVALSPQRLETKREDDLDLLIVNDATGLTALHWVTTTSPQRLMKSALTDVQGRKLRIENMQWERIHDGTQVPFGRLLSFEDQDGVTQIEIEFSEIKKNVPASLPFHIPDHYTQVR